MRKRALIVGAGGMGRTWARNLQENAVELVAWVDRSPDALQSALQELAAKNVETDTDFAKLLSKTDPDFVIDVTTPESHRDVVIHALESGYPVLGEKPMADSLEAAREMVDASKRAGKLYMVSQSRRYLHLQEGFRALISAIGPTGILNCDFYIGAHFGGFRDQMPSPLVLDMAIHTFDQARYLTGADPKEVFCTEFNPSWSWYEGAASATACFAMGDDLYFTYRGSWCAEGLNTSWDGEWRAVGPKGTAFWPGSSPAYAEVVDGGEGFIRKGTKIEAPPSPPNYAEGIAGSLKEFLDAIETGRTPNGECSDNIKSLAMVFGATLSASERRPVRIHEDRLVVVS